MFTPLPSYSVVELFDENKDKSYEIYNGKSLIGFTSGWKSMIRFFSDRLDDGFRDDIPVTLYLGEDRKNVARLTLEGVALLK